MALADLIDAHRGAFEYDWRSRFHKPLTVVGRSMSWGEGLRLTRILLTDPSSQVLAAVNGWDYATAREALALMDLYDRFTDVNFKKAAPYPRPWVQESASRRRGDAAGRTREQVRDILNAHGHALN